MKVKGLFFSLNSKGSLQMQPIGAFLNLPGKPVCFFMKLRSLIVISFPSNFTKDSGICLDFYGAGVRDLDCADP